MSILSITNPKSQVDWSSVKGNSAPSQSLIERIINLVKRLLGLESTTDTPSIHQYKPIPKKTSSDSEKKRQDLPLNEFLVGIVFKEGSKITPEILAKHLTDKIEIFMQNKEWDKALAAAKAGLELTGVTTETRAKLENLKESAEIVLQTLDSASKRASALHQEKLVRRNVQGVVFHPYNCSIPGIVSVRDPESTS